MSVMPNKFVMIQGHVSRKRTKEVEQRWTEILKENMVAINPALISKIYHRPFICDENEYIVSNPKMTTILFTYGVYIEVCGTVEEVVAHINKQL
jgi:hypothetical protein